MPVGCKWRVNMSKFLLTVCAFELLYRRQHREFAKVLGSTELQWKQIFAKDGRAYRPPLLVLYRGATQGLRGGVGEAILAEAADHSIAWSARGNPAQWALLQCPTSPRNGLGTPISLAHRKALAWRLKDGLCGAQQLLRACRSSRRLFETRYPTTERLD
jgi:Putative neutral zinc metallopeptidase